MSSVMTKKGLALLAKAQAGTKINFTKVKFGDGKFTTGKLEDLNDLINPIKSNKITSVDNVGAGKVRIRVICDNKDLAKDLVLREIGLFATDPDVGEILYCIYNAGESASVLPKDSAVVVEKTIDIVTIISNAANVTATLADDLVWTSVYDFNEHRTKAEIDHPDESVTDRKIGDRTINDNIVADNKTGSLTNLLSKLGNMIKNITGKSNWYTTPATTLQALSDLIADVASPNKLLKLDANSKLPANINGDAHTVDGKHANEFLYRKKGFFTVGGTSDTFYPVLFKMSQVVATGHLVDTELCLTRYIHTDGQFIGALNFAMKGSSSDWGGGVYHKTTMNFYSRQKFVADCTFAQYSGFEIIVWLRGGLAYDYELRSQNDTNVTVDAAGSSKTCTNNQVFNPTQTVITPDGYAINDKAIATIDNIMNLDEATVGDISYCQVLKKNHVKANGAILKASEYLRLKNFVIENNLSVNENEWQVGRQGMYVYNATADTLRVPDLRGEFLRGLDDGRGIDSGRGLGTAQGDAIRNITASTTFCSDDNGSSGVGPSNYNGAFYGSGTTNAYITDHDGWRAGAVRLHFDASKVVPTAEENRSRNIALIVQIKY